MAYSCKHLCFLFLLVIFSSIQIQARESKFFSKVTHYSVTKNNGKKDSIASVPIQAPTPALAPALPVEAPAPAPEPVFSIDSEYGYRPFGPGSGMFLPKKETSTATPAAATTISDEKELLKEELDGVTYNEKYQSSNYNNNNGYKLGSARYEVGNQNNNGYTNNYNNNGYNGNYNYNGYKLGERYETSNQNNENGYNNYNNNGYRSNNYNNNNGYTTNNNNNNNNNNGYTTNYNNNGYNTERHGMSDTRYMEGGKYYYNVKNENYYLTNDEFEPGKVSTQNQGYYGNNESPNEFNSMEKYESQEGYEENQEESFP